MRIPLRFFAAHWEDPTALTLHHRGLFVKFPEGQFIITYASFQPVTIEATARAQENLYACDTNVNRYFFFYNPNEQLVDDLKSYHILSFWTAGPKHNGSWDGMSSSQ